jgi:hypothetical protein
MSLEEFVSRIKDFNALAASRKIDYFVYFLTVVKGQPGIRSKEVNECFDDLKIEKYSNISQYLSKNAQKSKGKAAKFILQKRTYHLERNCKAVIDSEVNAPRSVVASDNYFPLELLSQTRTYLVTIANQAGSCFDNGLFDACSVMTRKLLEVLIIEAFERYNLSAKIKNKNGQFYYLSDLIDVFIAETSWNIGRNAKSSMPSLKKLGDLSAHNRRYVARKTDLEKIKGDLRIVLEELIHLIDYPNWTHT